MVLSPIPAEPFVSDLELSASRIYFDSDTIFSFFAARTIDSGIEVTAEFPGDQVFFAFGNGMIDVYG